MNVTAQKFQSQYESVSKPLVWSNHRTTLPQSALRAASSLREGAGMGLHHPSGYSLKSGVTGDFHRPYATLMVLAYTIHRTTLPQSALRAASSLREGAGKRSHSSGYSLKSRVAGDFHRPYEALMILAFTIHRTTLPQSALRAASSLREGAWKRSHSTGYLRNRGVAGDFHRPYEGGESIHGVV